MSWKRQLAKPVEAGVKELLKDGAGGGSGQGGDGLGGLGCVLLVVLAVAVTACLNWLSTLFQEDRGAFYTLVVVVLMVLGGLVLLIRDKMHQEASDADKSAAMPAEQNDEKTERRIPLRVPTTRTKQQRLRAPDLPLIDRLPPEWKESFLKLPGATQQQMIHLPTGEAIQWLKDLEEYRNRF